MKVALVLAALAMVAQAEPIKERRAVTTSVKATTTKTSVKTTTTKTSVKTTAKTSVKTSVKSSAKSTAKTTVKTSAKTTGKTTGKSTGKVTKTTSPAQPTSTCSSAIPQCASFADGSDTCIDVWACMGQKQPAVLGKYAIVTTISSTKDSIEFVRTNEADENLVPYRVKSITGWTSGSISTSCDVNGITGSYNLKAGQAVAPSSDRTAVCGLTTGASLQINSNNVINKVRSLVLCTTNKQVPGGAAPTRREAENKLVGRADTCSNWAFAPSCSTSNGCIDVVACAATGAETFNVGGGSFGIKQATQPTTPESLYIYSLGGNRKVQIKSALCRRTDFVRFYDAIAEKLGPKTTCLAGQTTNIGQTLNIGTTQDTEGLIFTGGPWGNVLHSLVVCAA